MHLASVFYFPAPRNSSSLATNSFDSGSTFEPKLATLAPSREITYLWKFQLGRSPVARARPSKKGEAPLFTEVFANIGNLTA